YLVTEFVDGVPLSVAVADGGPLDESTLHGVAMGVAVALSAVHAAGVVHRDLKPGNVLLSLSGPRVIDFGIARARDVARQHTQAGMLVGTPGWMAPEQFRGGAVGPAADVFSWGSLVAFAATGRNPWSAAASGPSLPPAEQAHRILHGVPTLDGLTGPLRRLVESALIKDPARRPTARQLVDALLGAPAAGDPTRAAVTALQRTWTGPVPGAPGPGRPNGRRAALGPPGVGAGPLGAGAGGSGAGGGQRGVGAGPSGAGARGTSGDPRGGGGRGAGAGPHSGGAGGAAGFAGGSRGGGAGSARNVGAPPGPAPWSRPVSSPGQGPAGTPVTRALPARRAEPTRYLPPGGAAPGEPPATSGAPAAGPQGGPAGSGPAGSGPAAGGVRPRKSWRRRTPDAPAPARKRRWYLRKRVILPLGLLAVVVLLSNRGDSTRPPTTGSQLGAPVRDGNLEFTVSRVRCGVRELGSGLVKRTATGQYCLADVKVKNVKDDARTLYEPFQKLVDSAGDKHGAEISMRLVLRDQTLWDKVEPGRQVSGTMVFDIPRDAKPERLELHDGIASGGVTVRLP
ncbi:MAG TPA: DUF4352 domain-containing protein, partial [Mycobacteriales bacterium]|nr:DUF4352 domain-containing protein [Mycobacteriales bacterium]